MTIGSIGTLGVVFATTQTGCAVSERVIPRLTAPEPPAPEEDELNDHLASALRSAALAQAAITMSPDQANVLGYVRDQRLEHATYLRREIVRARGRRVTDPPMTTDDGIAPTDDAVAEYAPSSPPSLQEVRTQLRESAEMAETYAVQASGYRAGLLASICASCHSHRVVLER
ncbi:hypothetical protein GCM10011410_11310 [Hoyosella rhizosphaerae]|uniref:DUF4439 domain-containing protein n=1 Tax=Hoyosella rhizosphaerae TaxID=1755582 RepID=A0A916XAX1_9ACTN|nr:hypothetical protein GCM10011410_11310 [Hoyosella rhizosphaerae]